MPLSRVLNALVSVNLTRIEDHVNIILKYFSQENATHSC